MVRTGALLQCCLTAYLIRHLKYLDRMATSDDPDQIAPLGAL